MTTKEEIIDKLCKKLNKSGWNAKLRKFWISREFEEIIEWLIHETEEGRRWVPGFNDCLRFLVECPVKNIKCVFLVDRVSTLFELNDGIPLSSRTCKEPDKMVRDILQTIPGQSDNPKMITDMATWAKQGVLMIPTACSARLSKEGHYKVWEPFIAYLINRINHDHPELPWVTMGRRTMEWEDMIKTEKKKSLSFVWLHKWPEMWTQVNEWIIENNQLEIDWLK